MIVRPIMITGDQKPTATSGGSTTSGVTVNRLMDDVVVNTIVDCTFPSTSQISLPAGTYLIQGWCLSGPILRNKGYLYNVTDAEVALPGTCAYCDGQSGTSICFIRGVLTITDTKVFEFRFWPQSTGPTTGQGVLGNSGQEQRFVNITVEQVSIP